MTYPKPITAFLMWLTVCCALGFLLGIGLSIKDRIDLLERQMAHNPCTETTE